MRDIIIYALCFFISGIIYEAETEVLITQEHYQECSGGNITLFSLEHDHSVNIPYDYIVNRRRKKRSIKLKNPDNQNEVLKLEVATLTGSCCWKLRDKTKGGYNPPYHMSIPGTFQPGWPIKAVYLLDGCPLET
jgi:hypothetical protein